MGGILPTKKVKQEPKIYHPYCVKIVFQGETGVGKTSVQRRYAAD